jgi:hypothetical protein
MYGKSLLFSGTGVLNEVPLKAGILKCQIKETGKLGK